MSEPGSEVDSKPAVSEDISTKDKLVGASEASPECFEIKVSAEAWKRKMDAEIESRAWLKSCFVDEAAVDWLKGKPLRELIVDTGNLRAGINLCADADGRDPVVWRRPNSDLKRWAMLEDVVRSLADFNLGPSGFFVICHRDCASDEASSPTA